MKFMKNKPLIIASSCLAIMVSIYTLWNIEPQRYPASPISESENKERFKVKSLKDFKDFTDIKIRKFKDKGSNTNGYSGSIVDRVFNDSNKIFLLVERVGNNKTFAWLKDISNLTDIEKNDEKASLVKMFRNLHDLLTTTENNDTITTPKDIEDIFIGNGYEPVLIVDNRPDIERNIQITRKVAIPVAGLGVAGAIGLGVISIASLPVSGPIYATLVGVWAVGLAGGSVNLIMARYYKQKRNGHHLDYSISMLIRSVLENWRQQEGIEQLDFISMFNPRTVDIEIK